MAELVDAADLKSVGPKRLWGFKSPCSHIRILISSDYEKPDLKADIQTTKYLTSVKRHRDQSKSTFLIAQKPSNSKFPQRERAPRNYFHSLMDKHLEPDEAF